MTFSSILNFSHCNKRALTSAETVFESFNLKKKLLLQRHEAKVMKRLYEYWFDSERTLDGDDLHIRIPMTEFDQFQYMNNSIECCRYEHGFYIRYSPKLIKITYKHVTFQYVTYRDISVEDLRNLVKIAILNAQEMIFCNTKLIGFNRDHFCN